MNKEKPKSHRLFSFSPLFVKDIESLARTLNKSYSTKFLSYYGLKSPKYLCQRKNKHLNS